MTPEANELSPPTNLPDTAGAEHPQGDDGEDQEARREIEKLAPSNDQLRSLIGSFQPPSGTFEDEEMPY